MLFSYKSTRHVSVLPRVENQYTNSADGIRLSSRAQRLLRLVRGGRRTKASRPIAEKVSRRRATNKRVDVVGNRAESTTPKHVTLLLQLSIPEYHQT